MLPSVNIGSQLHVYLRSLKFPAKVTKTDPSTMPENRMLHLFICQLIVHWTIVFYASSTYRFDKETVEIIMQFHGHIDIGSVFVKKGKKKSQQHH